MSFTSKEEMDTVFLLEGLAQQVVTCEKRVADQLSWLESRATDVRRSLEDGSSNNSLGELQGLAAGFDLAIGRLELAAETFKSAWRVLRHLTEADETDTPAEAMARQMVLHHVERSPRLARIVK